MYLCPVDLPKLQALCGFDVTNRYQGLQKFFLKYDMKDEADWMTKRIEFILQQTAAKLTKTAVMSNPSLIVNGEVHLT